MRVRRFGSSPTGKRKPFVSGFRTSASVMPCATATPESPQPSTIWRGRVARDFLRRPSIRNIAPRPRRPPTMQCSALAAMRWQPALRTLPPFYDDPLYIEALAANLKRQLAELRFEPERLL